MKSIQTCWSFWMQVCHAAVTPLKGIKKHPNGFTIENVSMGDPAGKLAKGGKKVVVKYVGRLAKNNKVFDQTKGNKTFTFRLGVGEVIKGWACLIELNLCFLGAGARACAIVSLYPNLEYFKPINSMIHTYDAFQSHCSFDLFVVLNVSYFSMVKQVKWDWKREIAQRLSMSKKCAHKSQEISTYLEEKKMKMQQVTDSIQDWVSYWYAGGIKAFRAWGLETNGSWQCHPKWLTAIKVSKTPFRAMPPWCLT